MKCRYSSLVFDCPKTPTNDCYIFCHERRRARGKGDMKLGNCGYDYNPFECQKMPCYDDCEHSEVKEDSEE